MKIKALFSGTFIFLPSLFLCLIANDTSPEEKILGAWKEVSWTYEKTDSSVPQKSTWIETIDKAVQKEIYTHLIIHQAERWIFSEDGKLQLAGDDAISVKWQLKGRGNVLELQYKNDEREQYFLQELTNDRLVLHFNSDLQVRGIVKMTFERID